MSVRRRVRTATMSSGRARWFLCIICIDSVYDIYMFHPSTRALMDNSWITISTASNITVKLPRPESECSRTALRFETDVVLIYRCVGHDVQTDSVSSRKGDNRVGQASLLLFFFFGASPSVVRGALALAASAAFFSALRAFFLALRSSSVSPASPCRIINTCRRIQ